MLRNPGELCRRPGQRSDRNAVSWSQLARHPRGTEGLTTDLEDRYPSFPSVRLCCRLCETKFGPWRLEVRIQDPQQQPGKANDGYRPAVCHHRVVDQGSTQRSRHGIDGIVGHFQFVHARFHQDTVSRVLGRQQHRILLRSPREPGIAERC